MSTTENTTQAEGMEQDTTTQAEGMTQTNEAAEQAASMGALLALADQEAPQAGAVMAEAAEPERVALSVELADAISASVMLLQPIFPSLQRVYTPQTVERIAVSAERVCIKRGWLANGLFAGASEEVMLAAVLIPVSLSTWAAVKGDLIRARVEEKPWLGWLARVTGWGKRKAAKPLPDEAPGAAAVTMGTPPAMGAAA